MTKFDETKVNRDDTGKFGEKLGSAPELDLTANDDVTCILTGAPGENEDDCTTHEHEKAPLFVHEVPHPVPAFNPGPTPVVGTHIYVDEGDSVGQSEYSGRVEEVDGTRVRMDGQWTDLADVVFWSETSQN